ncbi:acyltransferase family protein [Pedobacter nyackensis]|uniref:Peptidoglycan/LPS O-acetylase OafA/YrhL, contains acyltransferase and SGNH-hydrolase domains n=1 Tax=Pedobacter nyackensis TaxID=475255 RepID=A0A1W2F155_9SPHI|nr:Peptidoglycan/LPS O-acetylase OafA/YrhL, contains acyltransferase and SGNH-hydrolase domains [Pedobacter nyackensis]
MLKVISTPKEKEKPLVNKINYPFVDFIRFISMIGIVWAHIPFFEQNETVTNILNKIDYPMIYLSFMQIFKFGVICFYLISGFLIGENLKNISPLSYFKRRLRTIGKPYIVVLVIFEIFTLISHFYIGKNTFSISAALDILKWSMFYSPLWFIPNYLLAFGIILLFYKYIRSKVFGLILFVIMVIYSIFLVYIPAYAMSHTTALFGFVFYLWLGIFIRQNNLIEKILRININVLILITLALFSISIIESYQLYRNNFTTVFNILRFSNQLYSISVFALLIKICNTPPKFHFLNPRKETYGIYLYHGFITSFLIPIIIGFIDQYFDVTVHYWYDYRISSFILLFLSFFIFCYVSTTLFVKLLLNYDIGYLNRS